MIMRTGDKVLISPDLTHAKDWTQGEVIEVENNPFVGIVISAKTADGNIFFGYKDLFEPVKEADSLKAYRDVKNSIDTALEKGREEGMAKGMEKEKLATARRLLSMGLSDEQVATATELPLEEIQKLKEQA